MVWSWQILCCDFIWNCFPFGHRNFPQVDRNQFQNVSDQKINCMWVLLFILWWPLFLLSKKLKGISMIWCLFYIFCEENMHYHNTWPPGLPRWSWESSTSRKTNGSSITFKTWRTYMVNEEKKKKPKTVVIIHFAWRFERIMKQSNFTNGYEGGESPNGGTMSFLNFHV